MTRWLLVAGDLTPLGGMDMANLALASYLAARGDEVHLAAHRVWPDLAENKHVTVHHAWRPLGSHWLGVPFLAHVGAKWARLLAGQGGRTIANGGNCPAGDINWVHYVHASYEDGAAGWKKCLARRRDLRMERAALAQSRVVVCNSRRTARDVIELLGVPEERTRIVYYGTEPNRFGPISPDERRAMRQRLGWDLHRPVVAFIGALGDRRKGFDVLYNSWRRLCASTDWDCGLAVLGAGNEMPRWRARAVQDRLASRFHFLGFRTDVAQVLAACDALVHPARYEAYGLGVHEALCRGLPALVSGQAGVAERYPPELRSLLLPDVEDADELAGRLRHWRDNREFLAATVAPFAASLRSRTWETMAREFVEAVTGEQES